jgi:four helix bundle protein
MDDLNGTVGMSRTNFENLRVYQLAERLADQVWEIVNRWPNLPRDTVGKQLIRAADSVGANIAEGTGRGSFQDNRRYVRIARGSLNETKHWLRRAYSRHLLGQLETDSLKGILDELSPRLNAYLRSIGPVKDTQRSPTCELPTKGEGPKTTVTGFGLGSGNGQAQE